MIQELLNLPILQIISLILVAGLAERMGIPVVSWIGNLLKLKNGNGKDIEELKGQIKAMAFICPLSSSISFPFPFFNLSKFPIQETTGIPIRSASPATRIRLII